MFQDRLWLEDFDALPPEKQVEVIDFIEFLKSRKSQTSSKNLTSSSPMSNQVPNNNSKSSFLERAQDLIGVVDDAPSDLATNPKHMQGFGE